MNQHKTGELAGLRPQLLNYAMLQLRDRARAEDAVQETLLAALEGLDRFAGESSLKTWLMGILRHKIVDCMRASAREEPLEVEADDAPLHESDPEERYLRRRLVGAVERSLNRLPENAARVFVLREILGMDTAEICRELAISSANCWVLLHRARLRLQQCPDIVRLAAAG
jgi:RNA polymerase sigma-70 factor (ECF subfamily)